MRKNIDTIKLSLGHNLILGNKPEIVTLDVLNKAIEESNHQDIGKFGLFESSSPNYTTYYPDVEAGDLTPKDDEFIYPTFRALSNTTVHPKMNPIFFSEEILKRAQYKLVGQTVNADHEVAVGNAIGSVSAIQWQAAYKTKDGIKVPAGINATLKIDGKSNPRIARAINMEPPSIHSTSVTVTFAWEKSHPTMSDEEFWNKLGTFDKEGKVVQRIVTNIEAFHEISLVSHGADYFAQKIGKDGKIVNPGYSASRYPFSDVSLSDAELSDLKKTTKHFTYDFKDLDTTSLSEETTILDETNNIQTTDKMDYLKLLATVFGITLTDENFQTSIQQVQDELADLRSKKEAFDAPLIIKGLTGKDAIQAELDRLSTEVADLTGQVEDQKTGVALSDTLVSELRVDALRLYKASLGEKPEDANIVNLINTSAYTTLKSLHKQYDELTDKQYQFSCSDCGSHNVSRMSSKPASEESEDKDKTSFEVIENFTGVPEKVNTKFFQ